MTSHHPTSTFIPLLIFIVAISSAVLGTPLTNAPHSSSLYPAANDFNNKDESNNNNNGSERLRLRYGWGRDGHIVTALVAQQLLSAHVTARLLQLLPEEKGQLADVSNWADEVKEQSGYFWSEPLHYINTPDWECGFNANRDCGDGMCVSGAIANYTRRLAEQRGEQQSEALKFLVHFCGDIHQPLHVGFTSDEGGNTIHVSYLGETDNLHQIWDSNLIYTLVDTEYNHSIENLTSYLLTQINSTWVTQAANWTTCAKGTFPCPAEWAQETAALACEYAYVEADGKTHVQNGTKLDMKYFERVKKVLEMQLARSAVRMTAAIEAALGE